MATSVPIPTTAAEVWYWRSTISGSFLVKSAWDHVRSKGQPLGWEKPIWKTYFQPRFSVFGWRLLHLRLPTDEVVRKKGVFIVPCCELCLAVEESLHHIFWECPFSTTMWVRFVSIFDFSWTGIPSIMEWLWWWKDKRKLCAMRTSGFWSWLWFLTIFGWRGLEECSEVWGKQI